MACEEERMFGGLRAPARSGFTLVELLVLIGIVGVLVSLLLPAVQAAREAARKTQCRNHLRQLGTAMTLHHDLHRHFATDGWGYCWVGDPTRGFNEQQPGGWVYNVLPFVEQQQLREVGSGLRDPEKRTALGGVLTTPVAVFNPIFRNLPYSQTTSASETG